MIVEVMKVVCVDDDDFMFKVLGCMICCMWFDWEIELVEDVNYWVVDVEYVFSVVIFDLLMLGKNGEVLLMELCVCCLEIMWVLLIGDMI